MKLELIVKNCNQCPFCNYDNFDGRNYCNLALSLRIEFNLTGELPEDKIHEECPIEGSVEIILEKQ